ncbi:MAG: hypothetical protein E7063_03075 [Spirochaetaceae bacterium]|nr:hypothetical protein [Spirochaetaceae bacterium]
MSFAPETEKLVEQIIQAEYKNACENWGEKYHSLHEGYAILLEEVEEVKESYADVDIYLEELWKGIRGWKLFDKEICLNKLLVDTQNAIKELAQVGAVLMKIKNTFEVEE